MPEGGSREWAESGWLHVEPKIHDICFFDDIILAFEAEQSLLFYLRLRPAGEQIVIEIDLGADEASLHVGMDLTGRLRGLGGSWNRPCARFNFASGEEGYQIQQGIGFPSQPHES